MLRPCYKKPMTPAEKQLLVQQVLKQAGQALDQHVGRAVLSESVERLREEIEAKLLAEGIPPSLLLYMRLASERRRLVHDAARKMFPVESLPDGALPIYDRDPEVASLVVDDAPAAGS